MTHPTTGTLPTIFTFQNGKPHPVRIYTDADGNPLFHVGDLCELLEHVNTRQALRTHVEADDVQKMDVIDRMGRKQQANFVREPGMWSLLLGSHAPNAKKVKRWITSEVLPAIRKTGSYHAVPPAPTFERMNMETKTERNCRVQKLYDELMAEGKHGHYETMFHIVRLEVEAEREACAKVCSDLADETGGGYSTGAWDCAAKIRERSNAKLTGAGSFIAARPAD